MSTDDIIIQMRMHEYINFCPFTSEKSFIPLLVVPTIRR